MSRGIRHFLHAIALPVGQFTIDNEADAIALAVFLLMGLGISLLAESAKRAHKRSEAKLQEFAYHDPLTHLPNRRLLKDRLNQAIARNLRTDIG